MKTIILAAGQGTRLRPYTDNVPKCMVPLAGIPLLHRQLNTMTEAGIRDNIAIVGGYKNEKLELLGHRLFINERFATTNMVETLFAARDFIDPREDLIISYGDIVYETKVLKSLLEYSKGEVVISADLDWERLWRLRMENPLSDAETFIMGSDQKINELGKKPNDNSQVQAQYMGLILIRKLAIQKMLDLYDSLDRNKIYDGKDFPNMYMTSFIQLMIDSGWDVRASLVHNGWLEVDTVDELDIYNRMNSDGALESYCKLQ